MFISGLIGGRGEEARLSFSRAAPINPLPRKAAHDFVNFVGRDNSI